MNENAATVAVAPSPEPHVSSHFDIEPNPQNPEELTVRLFTCTGSVAPCAEQPMRGIDIALVDGDGQLLESNHTDEHGEATVLAETAFISQAYLAIDGTVIERSQGMLQAAGREAIRLMDATRREREARQQLVDAAERARAEGEAERQQEREAYCAPRARRVAQLEQAFATMLSAPRRTQESAGMLFVVEALGLNEERSYVQTMLLMESGQRVVAQMVIARARGDGRGSQDGRVLVLRRIAADWGQSIRVDNALLLLRCSEPPPEAALAAEPQRPVW